MSPHPTSANSQQLVEELADGRCSALQRRDGASVKYLPTVDGVVVTDNGLVVAYAEKRKAVAAARRAKARLNDAIADAQGSM